MLNKILRKLSNFFYKLHLFINEQNKEKSSFTPYKVKSTLTSGDKKIIHINGNFIVGGTSQLIVDIIERTSSIFSHSIVVPDYPDPLPYYPVSISKFSIREMPLLYDYLKNLKPTLVHIHYWTRYIHRYEEFALWYEAVFKICEELNIKVIQNINVPTKPHNSNSIIHNVFVSRYVLDNYNDTNVASSIIYPGSDFSHFHNDNIEELPANCIGMVYRLDRDKLNAEAIEIFITVAKRIPSIKCLIIGGGYYLEYYKERVAEEQLERNVLFTGYVSYELLPSYYKKMGIFVAPVHDESFGQVTPFAMSMGLCVVGYNIGALSEILGYKDTLVEYGDITGLSNLIIDLLNNPQKRKSLGIQNKNRALENFTIEQMVQQYQKLYTSCIKYN